MKLTADQAATYKAMIESREGFKNQYSRMQYGKSYNMRLNVLLLDELEGIYNEDLYKTAEETELLYDILKEYGRIADCKTAGGVR